MRSRFKIKYKGKTGYLKRRERWGWREPRWVFTLDKTKAQKFTLTQVQAFKKDKDKKGNTFKVIERLDKPYNMANTRLKVRDLKTRILRYREGRLSEVRSCKFNINQILDRKARIEKRLTFHSKRIEEVNQRLRELS